MGVLKTIILKNQYPDTYTPYTAKINIVDSTIFDLSGNNSNNIIVLMQDKKTVLPSYFTVFENPNIELFVKIPVLYGYQQLKIYLYIDKNHKFSFPTYTQEDVRLSYINFTNVDLNTAEQYFDVIQPIDGNITNSIDSDGLKFTFSVLSNSTQFSFGMSGVKNLQVLNLNSLTAETNVKTYLQNGYQYFQTLTFLDLITNNTDSSIAYTKNNVDHNLNEIIKVNNGVYNYSRITEIISNNNIISSNNILNTINDIINQLKIYIYFYNQGGTADTIYVSWKYFKIYQFQSSINTYLNDNIPYTLTSLNTNFSSPIIINSTNSNISQDKSKLYLQNILSTYNWNINQFNLPISNINNIITPTSYSNVLKISPFVHFNDYDFRISVSNTLSLFNLISFKVLETQLITTMNSIYLKLNENLNLIYDFNLKQQKDFNNLLYNEILNIVQLSNIIGYKTLISDVLYISNSYFINNYSDILTLNMLQKGLYSYLNKITNQEFSIVYYSIKIPITDLYFNYKYSSLFSNIQILFTNYSLLLHESQEYEIHNYSIDFYFKKMLFIDKIIRKYIIIPNIDNLYTVFNS